MEKEIKETLKKQLQLLSERSYSCENDELPAITQAMVEIVNLLV